MTVQWYQMICAEGGDAWKHTLRTSKENLFGIDYFVLHRGEAVANWNPRCWLGADMSEDDGEPFDVLCDHLGLPIFSERLQSALLEHPVQPEEVQLLPVRLIRPTKEEIRGFSIVNILHPVDSLDVDRSKLVLRDPKMIDPLTNLPRVRAIGHYALRADALKGRSIIRLENHTIPVFVCQQFVNVFRSGGFTGAIFMPVIMV